MKDIQRNNLVSNPSYYDRNFENDVPEIKNKEQSITVGGHSLTITADTVRKSLTAIFPLICSFKPVGRAMSIALDSVNSIKSIMHFRHQVNEQGFKALPNSVSIRNDTYSASIRSIFEYRERNG